jgi:hypothetical protein
MSKDYITDRGFNWFIGVVEDNNDPVKLGRCRVRIIGLHSSDRSIQPTDQLPWAMPMQPITSAAISGKGTTPLGVLNGTHVVGFFIDGANQQNPVIMGTLGKLHKSKPDPSRGFSDPDGVYPIETRVGEPDTNRLARNEGLTGASIVQQKIDTVETDIPTALGNTWNEPVTPYSAEYPKNHVLETESGHVQEFDDTPEAERIHTYHKSGTFEEIHPDGSKVERIMGDKYEICKNDSKVLIRGDADITTDGNAKLLVNESLAVEVSNGGINIKVVGGDLNLNVDGGSVRSRINTRGGVVRQDITAPNVVENIDGNKITTVSGNCSMIANGTFSIRGSSVRIN